MVPAWEFATSLSTALCPPLVAKLGVNANMFAREDKHTDSCSEPTAATQMMGSMRATADQLLCGDFDWRSSWLLYQMHGLESSLYSMLTFPAAVASSWLVFLVRSTATTHFVAISVAAGRIELVALTLCLCTVGGQAHTRHMCCLLLCLSVLQCPACTATGGNTRWRFQTLAHPVTQRCYIVHTQIE